MKEKATLFLKFIALLNFVGADRVVRPYGSFRTKQKAENAIALSAQ